MSEENLELARRSCEMFNRRDLDGWLQMMAQDVRFQPQMGPASDGHEAIRRYWDLLIEGANLTVEIEDARDVGTDRVLTQVRQRGQARGVTFDDPLWVPSRWREGKCVWWGVFFSEQDALNALEAAGLSE